jgi:leucyl-tRNA synthetase
MKMLHKAIKKIEQDIENYKFNTAFAQMMILLNTGEPVDADKNLEWKRAFIQLLHPFAPHMAEECWESVAPQRQEILKVYFATGNDGKVKRAQSVLDTLRSKITLEVIPELKNVEETGVTPLECVLQKIEAHKDAAYTIPVIAADTSVYFEGQDFNPTHLRRVAIQAA